MDDGAEGELVADVGKRRHGGLDHDRLVDLEGGFGGAELALPRGGDGDDAITREAIGCFEFGAGAALRVGAKGGVPEGCGDEVGAQAFEQAGPAFAVADEITFVCEIRFGRVFAEERGQGEISGDAETARLIEERERVGRFVAGQTEDAFVHGVEHDLGVGGGLAAGVLHRGFEVDEVARFRGGLGGLDRDGEFVFRLRDFEVGVADAVLGRFDFARAVVRAAQEHDGDENVRAIGRRDRHLHGGRVAG